MSFLILFSLSKFCHSTPFLDVNPTPSCSGAWKGILHGRDVLLKVIRWQIGTGEQISIWNDFWLPSPLPISLNSCLSDDAPISSFLSLKNAIVNKLFNPGKLEWNANLVSSLFPRDISSSILSIPLSQCGFEDRFVWGFTKNGNFSSTSDSLLLGLKLHHNSYSFGRSVHFFRPNLSWKFIWSLPIPHKIQIFLWQLSHECLPVGDLLASRGWRAVLVCCFCKQHSDQSLVHLFLHCDFVRSVWFGADLGFYISSTPNHSIPFWLGWVHHIGILMSLKIQNFYTKIACILRCILLARNKAVFESILSSPTQVIIHVNLLSHSISQAFASLKPSSLSPPKNPF